MPYDVRHWPDSVGKKELNGLPTEARAEAKGVIRDLAAFGPQPPGRAAKALKGHLHGLWQLSLKVNREQIRILYFVWQNKIIVVVSVFKKTSTQLQQREYDTAIERMKTAQRILRRDEDGHEFATFN